MRCRSGKKMHTTEANAHKHRRALAAWNAKNSIFNEKPLNVYWCALCDFFHVGHSDIPPQRKPTTGANNE